MGLTLYGSGFDLDAGLYSVVLVDDDGLVANTVVTSITYHSLHLEVHGIGRDSTEARIVLREGVTIPLFGQETGDTEILESSWFQGTGERHIVGDLAFTSLEGHEGNGSNTWLEWPLGCSEITAKVTISGNDPFDPGLRFFHLPTKGAEAVRDYWQARATVRLAGEAAADPIVGAARLAEALSSQFELFGVRAQPIADASPPHVGLHWLGERLTAGAGASLLEVKCLP